MKTKKAWQQLSDETNPAYSYFISYMEMGRDRSLLKVCQKYTKKETYLTQLKKWSTKYNWVERAAAYDEHIATQTVEQQEHIIRKAKALALENIESVIQEMISTVQSERPDKLEAAKILLGIAGMHTDGNDAVKTDRPTYQKINRYILQQSANQNDSNSGS